MKRYFQLSLNRWILGAFLALAMILPAFGVTLQDLRADQALTPENFASYFKDFEFELHENVQVPDVFLSSKKGDCDDYATLAADILKAKGYTTRLVVVFMPKDIHVVCYVEETKCFLDFNRRNLPQTTVPSKGTLDEIAEKVAQSFHSKWHCVSEFTFSKGTRQFVFTDFPQEKQEAPLVIESERSPKPLVSKAP